MENALVNRYMRLLSPLKVEIKFALLEKLTESLKKDFYAKPIDRLALLDELAGSWSDMEDGIEEDILNARTTNVREINFE
ncbi:MAG: hypothetical protein AAF806_19255 [Bacteroidota bacterium]